METTVLFKGDSRSAQKAVADLRAAIQEQAKTVVKVNAEMAESTKLSGDAVFRQLTQFRIGLSQIARGDLGGIPNLIKGIQLAGNEVVEAKAKVATFKQSIDALDATLAAAGKKDKASSFFDSFKQSVEQAATGTDENATKMKARLEKYGVDVERALLNPKKAFTDYLRILGSPALTGSQLKEASKVLDVTTKETAQAIANAGKAVNEFEAAETAATGGARLLAGGLSATTLVIGAAALAAVGLGVALVAMANKVAEAQAELERLQDNTGASQRFLLDLSAGAKVLNVDLGTLTGGFNKFKESLEKSLQGDKKTIELLRILGIEAKKAAQDPEAAFKQLALALDTVQDSSVRAAVAQELLGNNGNATIRYFKEFANVKKDIDSVNDALSGEGLKAAKDYNRQIELLKLESGKLATVIGIEVLPTLTSLIQTFREISEFTAKYKDQIIDIIYLIGNPYAAAVRQLQKLTSEPLPEVQGPTFDPAKIQKQTDAKSKALRDALTNEKKERDTASRNELRELETKLRDVEQEYRDNNQRLERLFQERLRTEEDFVKESEVLVNKKRVDALKLLLDEKAVINNSKLKPDEKKLELAQIADKAKDLERDTAAQIEGIRFASRQRLRQADRQLLQETLQTAAQAAQAKIDAVQDAVDKELLTYEQGEERITAFLVTEIERRINAQKVAISDAGINKQQIAIEEERLIQLEREKTEAIEEGERRRRQARAKDIANQRAAINELKQIQNETAQLDLNALVTAGQIDIADGIRANAEIERQIIRDTAAIRIAALLDQLNKNAEFTAQDAEQKQQQADNEKRLTDLIIAENERRTAALKGSVAAQNKALDGVTGIGKLKDTLKGVASAFASTAVAAVSSNQSIGQALSGLVAATATSVAQIAAIEVVKNLAYAASAAGLFTLGNIPAGKSVGDFLAAAALWGGLAVGAAAVGSAFSSSGGGSGGNGGLNGTRQNENTLTTEERIRFRESGALRPVTTIVIKHETGMFVEKVETALTQSYRNDGAARKIVDNATSGIPL